MLLTLLTLHGPSSVNKKPDLTNRPQVLSFNFPFSSQRILESSRKIPRTVSVSSYEKVFPCSLDLNHEEDEYASLNFQCKCISKAPWLTHKCSMGGIAYVPNVGFSLDFFLGMIYPEVAVEVLPACLRCHQVLVRRWEGGSQPQIPDEPPLRSHHSSLPK